MKTNKLSFLYILVMDLACSPPNTVLIEANKIHMENFELFHVIENKLDSLQKLKIDNIQKVELQKCRIELKALEESVIEVPGYEHKHQHDGHNHRNELPINYTDEQILAIQKEVKFELEKLNMKF